MFRLALSSLGLALVASGCIAAPAGDFFRLDDTRWHFAAIDGAAPVSADAALTFRAGRIGANVGCNGMGGPWRIERGRLIAGPLISTQMWCEGKMEQERAVSALLSGSPEVRVNGARMSLKSGGHSAELVRQ